MTKLTMVQALNQALMQAMESFPDVVVLGEDIATLGGVFRVTDGLLKKFGTGRVIDTPIAETLIIGSSVGMALNGLKPVAEIQFDGFVYQGFNQLVTQVSRLRNRSRGRFTVPLVIRFPYGGGVRALEMHTESMEALYIAIPGLKVVMPSCPYDAKGLLLAAINDPDPVIFMEPKRLYHAFKEEVPEELYEIPLGKANILQEGSDLTIISWGAMLKEVKEADETLKQNGIKAEIIDLRTLSPLDRKTLVSSVKKTGRCLIVQEAPRTVSLSSEIAAYLQEKCLYDLHAPIRRITAPDVIYPYYQLEKYYMPSTQKIIKAALEMMES